MTKAYPPMSLFLAVAIVAGATLILATLPRNDTITASHPTEYTIGSDPSHVIEFQAMGRDCIAFTNIHGVDLECFR